MSWAAQKFLLLGGICFIDQEPSGLERRNQSREELPLKIEEDHNEIVSLRAQIVHLVEIGYLGFKQGSYSGVLVLARILPGQFNAGFGNIHQLHLPAALGQPQGVASYASGYIEGFARIAIFQKFSIGIQQKRVWHEISVRAFDS